MMGLRKTRCRIVFYPPSQKATALAVDECQKDNPPKPCAQEGMLRRIPPKKWRDHGLVRGAPFFELPLFHHSTIPLFQDLVVLT
jgi:hypothetical protein